MRVKGKIVQWKGDKGFGFIEVNNGNSEVFFHQNCLLYQVKKPNVGDEVSFEIATNQEGKRRAERILFRGERDPRRIDRTVDIVCLAVSSLFLTGIGALVYYKKLDPIVLICYWTISAVALFLYWHDKVKSKNDQRRIPENKLHFYSLIGGWPGALIAQRIFHHKSRKKSFLLKYWLTVSLNISLLIFYVYFGSDFLKYDMFVRKYKNITNNYVAVFGGDEKNNESKARKFPMYSWINKEGNRVYSNRGFPPNEPYRDGRIEWQ
jgi:uncharacterized membrane protein YsdA (DUF1294 family)/cold shock CspA family protein